MLNLFCLWQVWKLFTQVLLSPTFDTVVLSGVVLDLQTSTSCKSCKIVLLESLQIAALIPPSRPLIEELGWNTIEQLISNESKTMVFKSLNELAPQYLCGLFAKNSQCSARTLRNADTDVRLPKKNSANGQKCFSFRGAKLLNSLSAESKQASSLNIFKKSL